MSVVSKDPCLEKVGQNGLNFQEKGELRVTFGLSIDTVIA
jgi:hypothetical protein